MVNHLISIILPVYNSEKYLQEAIESILNQSHKNFELLIMEDGSTDDSIKILNSIEDERVKIYLSENNLGQANQLNKGISISKGDFIAIMHADDIMYKDKLQKQLNFLAENKKIDICGCNVQLIGEKSEIWKYPISNSACKDILLKSVPFAHPTILARKEIFTDQYEPYKQEMVPVEDYDLWVRLANKYEYANINEVLLSYRIHSEQISQVNKSKEVQLIYKIRLNLVEQLICPDKSKLYSCFKAIYESDKMSPKEILKALVEVWESNKKNNIFSKIGLRSFIKHKTVINLLKLSLRERITILFSKNQLFEILYFKSIIKVILN